jgi:hypothetical protein
MTYYDKVALASAARSEYSLSLSLSGLLTDVNSGRARRDPKSQGRGRTLNLGGIIRRHQLQFNNGC